MKILIASSETVPFVKTGGLGDVTGALADEYVQAGVDSSVILPFYRCVKGVASSLKLTPLGREITCSVGNFVERGVLWKGKTSGGANAYFIENDSYYDRDELYGTSDGDYPDNAARFMFFCHAVPETIKTLGLETDIIHCNDWQTALIPLFLATHYKDSLPHTATLLSIHNMGYQGVFDTLSPGIPDLAGTLPDAGVLEHNGYINFLKTGIVSANVITTVSPRYAREILKPEFGFGLEEFLKHRADELYGIINGIDYTEWNPELDSRIESRYGTENMEGKYACKRSLQETMGLQVSESPLIGMVTRLAYQKGLDITVKAVEDIIRSGAQLIVLGKGDPLLEKEFLQLQEKHRGRLSVTIGFNNDLAHRIYAGTDMFLMPSRYEPCGLGQLIALRYGSVPVVRKTGGLSDTIEEFHPGAGTGTGFLFEQYSAPALRTAVNKAVSLYDNKEGWDTIRRNAMTRDFSWKRSARDYLSLYKRVLNRKDQ